MTPNIIVVQARAKVKSQVFGKVVLHVGSCTKIDGAWLQVEQIFINTFSGESYCPTVHDWNIVWTEVEDAYSGVLNVQISHTFEASEEDAIYTANYAINELYVDIPNVRTNVGLLKVHDFSIEFENVYSE